MRWETLRSFEAQTIALVKKELRPSFPHGARDFFYGVSLLYEDKHIKARLYLARRFPLTYYFITEELMAFTPNKDTPYLDTILHPTFYFGTYASQSQANAFVEDLARVVFESRSKDI